MRGAKRPRRTPESHRLPGPSVTPDFVVSSSASAACETLASRGTSRQAVPCFRGGILVGTLLTAPSLGAACGVSAFGELTGSLIRQPARLLGGQREADGPVIEPEPQRDPAWRFG
jgi:hypothetical protein